MDATEYAAIYFDTIRNGTEEEAIAALSKIVSFAKLTGKVHMSNRVKRDMEAVIIEFPKRGTA